MKVVIIEDEVPAARLLYSMVVAMRPEWEVEILPGNVEEAVGWFKVHPHPDLIFLDIQLSDGDSFDFLSEAKPASTIIFTTAYDEYAIRAFGVNSIDYILKPIDEKRLLDAILKYETFSKNRSVKPNDYLDTILDSLSRKEKRFRSRFLISGPDKFWTLQISDIAYFYSENRVTFAVTHTGKEHIVDLSLNKLEEQLDPDLFFRANRQVLLSVTSIIQVEPYFNNKVVVLVKPPHKMKITVSEDKMSSFKLWLNF